MSDRTKGEVYNCASGIKVTIRELADKILAHFGRKDLPIEYGDWTPGDIKVFDVANQKSRDLGFTFETKFDDGLKETLSWLELFLSKKA